MIFRTILWFLRSSRRSRLKITDVGRMPLRVVPTDIDTLRHVNNGVYLSYMDLGRVDLMIRSGAWSALSKLGYYPVVASQTISYRRSLELWQRFELETRLIGLDAKAVYCEQRFTVGGEIYARGFVKARFLKKSGGTVSVAELTDAVGTELAAVELPAWVEQWSSDVALPPSKAPAPSEWPAS
jgi:YbgC/YbaW family acyl-CoA thioester hydrolase